jgi:hypothetical protein
MSNGKKIDDREERKLQKALMKASIAEATVNIHGFRQRAAWQLTKKLYRTGIQKKQ